MTSKQSVGNHNVSVFITGASTGIGKTCALYLDKLGFHVFAGVRKTIDGDALRQESSNRLQTIIIDVADAASIDAAVNTVAREAQNKLFGLINNAGIAFGGPLEILPIEDIKTLLKVNVAGVLAVTKAFLPLLRQGRGRIINMGSSSGLFALPCLSVYAASKFALEAITDSLRVELRPLEISVIIIEAGNVTTPIWEKGVDTTKKIVADARPEILHLYQPLIEFSKKIALNSPKLSAAKVATVVGKALGARKPRARYVIGADARLLKLARHVPCRVRDWIILKIIPKYGYY
jgi:NAD(P)-dependent dehydrogenase (short-subunit alcohol dehydrogenase family)